MVNLDLVAQNLREALHVVGRPGLVHLAVLAEVGLHQVERRRYAHQREAARAERQLDLARDVALRREEHRLDVAHDGLEVLRLVEEHAVPGGHLLLPVELPLGQHVLLEHLVGRDDEHRRGGLEAHAALDADDGVADVHVAADAVARADGLDGADGLDAVGVGGAVDRRELALGEAQAKRLLARGRNLARIGLLGERLLRAERLAAADGGAPESLVDGVLHLAEVGLEAVAAQVVDFIFAREGHVARRGDDFDFGSQHLERQVETHLVVACAGRAVGNGVGADLLGVSDDGDGLEDALRADRDGVGAVAQDVAVDHVADALFVVLLLDVERGVLHGAQRQGALFDACQFVGRETARVGDGRIDVVTLLFGEIFHTERGVQTAAERQYHFLLFHFRLILFLFYVVRCFPGADSRIFGSVRRPYLRWKSLRNRFRRNIT